MTSRTFRAILRNKYRTEIPRLYGMKECRRSGWLLTRWPKFANPWTPTQEWAAFLLRVIETKEPHDA